MSYTLNQDSQRTALIGTIMRLMKDLQTLAPHPDQPHNRGPLFIKNNPYFKVANDHDGMLGSMLMESFLGAVYSEAISDSFGEWTEDIDVSTIMELYDIYVTDIEDEEEKQYKAAHGQGTMARMSGKSISGSFNLRGNMDAPTQAFMNDMPKRMKIERDLAYYAQELEQLETNKAPLPQKAFAA